LLPLPSDAAPPARQNVRVNDPALDVDHHETRSSSIAARGPLVVVGFEDATWTAAGYAVSTDGGATFVHRRIPMADGVYAWGSPSVAIGPSGEIFYAFLASAASDPPGVTLAKSTDGGVTFPLRSSPSGFLENGYASMDSPVVAVDNGAASPRKGTVYVAWTYYDPYSYFWAVVVVSSSDGGASFSAPKAFPPSISSGVKVGRPALAVAPNGDLWVAYENGYSSPDGIAIARSTDGGGAFTLRSLATFQPSGRLSAGGGGVEANSGPSLAVDGAGAVHVAWAGVSSGATTDRSDVFYTRSTDAGATFSAVRKLNDDGTQTTQAFPAIAALADGTVAVRWADRRSDPGHDASNGVAMALSRDGGSTWGKSFRVTDRSAPWGPAPHSLGATAHASREGLAADGGNFYVAWTDGRSGNADVYAAVVPETFDGGAPDFDLSPTASYAAVAQGGTAAFDLVATGVNGFTGTLVLASDLAPANLSLSLASASVTPGQTVRLTVTASPSTPPGDYVVGVAASSAGLERGARMRITVTASSRGFGPSVNVTGTPGFSTGSVRADASGVLHAVFDDDSGQVTGSEVFYRRSTDGGATFSAPVKLHATGSYAHQSAFTIDPTGRIFVVWSGRTIADPSPRIYFAKSTDGGATFSAPVAVNGTTGYAVFPNVAADRNGNLVVGWFDLSGTAPVVGWSRSTNAGTSFSTPVPVYDTPVVFTRPGVAIDSKNNAYLAWTQQTSSASVIRLAVSKAGAAFGSPTTVTDAAALSFAPDLAIAPDDGVGLAYYARAVVDGTAQNRRIAFQRSTNGGTSFGAPVLLSSAADQAYAPSLAYEASGALDVAWEEFDANDVQSDVFLARSTDGGATFSAPVNVSADGGFSGSSADPQDGIGGPGRASVSPGPAGTLAVSFTDDTGGGADLFLAMPRAALISNRPPVATIASPAPNASFEIASPVTFTGSGTDPDGDPVTLTWDFGDGRTATGASPAPVPFATPGPHVVTLTARDPNGGIGTASVTINVVPIGAGPADVILMIPVVLEASGVGGSRYTSEVTLVSRLGQSTDVFLAYNPSVGSGSGLARVRLAAGEMKVLPGILDWLRTQGVPIPSDGSTQVGTLAVVYPGALTNVLSDPSAVWAGARTFTPDPLGSGGTFGLFMPADRVPPVLDPLPGAFVTLAGLQQNASQRSNVAVVNEGSASTVVRVSLQGAAGEDLGTLPDLALPPGGWYQYNQPLAGKAQSGRAIVRHVSGDPRVTSYAVLNDAVTSDGSFLPPFRGDAGSPPDLLVPVVLDVAGLGARFRTELTLTNLSTSPLALTLVYTAAAGFGSGSGSVALTLAPGEQRIVPDVIAFLRGMLPIENDGRNVGGSLRVTGPAGAPGSALAVGARTFVPLSPAGSYGLFYPALSANQCATGTAWVYGLQENASQRSNLAVVNRGDAGDAITLRVTFYGANGGALGAPVDRVLAPGEWTQLGRPLAGLGVAAGYAKVEKISGASRFAAYGVLNDNVTSDGSYVAMSF
jgi:hypothetical protein